MAAHVARVPSRGGGGGGGGGGGDKGVDGEEHIWLDATASGESAEAVSESLAAE
jgi:hypothetical protein